jgi:hypothetical protein
MRRVMRTPKERLARGAILLRRLFHRFIFKIFIV